jgi:hypothetical protein
MLTFFFWNLKKRPLQDMLAEAAREHSIDIFVLAECTIPVNTLIRKINSAKTGVYSIAYSPTRKVLFISRFPSIAIRLVRDESGIAIRRVQPPIGPDFLLAVAHLPSRLFQTDIDQTLLSTRVAELIRTAESDVKHTRTILVGDLNMDPFHAGVVGAQGLHGTMSRVIAAQNDRVVSGMRYSFFYNPMWSRFGERSGQPHGTYFYKGSASVSQFWHVFDQVLIRPSLLNNFRDEDLIVLSKIGSTSLLLPSGIPDTQVASDHLPLLFKLTKFV